VRTPRNEAMDLMDQMFNNPGDSKYTTDRIVLCIIKAAVDECRAELGQRTEKMKNALERVRDCEWVITLPNRMDAVRAIAREALE
jgi:hypothetical protein